LKTELQGVKMLPSSVKRFKFAKVLTLLYYFYRKKGLKI